MLIHPARGRMALAAAETAYARKDLVTNGPTLQNCSVGENSVRIQFDDVHLKDDAVHVFKGVLAGYDLPSDLAEELCADLDGGSDHSPSVSVGAVGRITRHQFLSLLSADSGC